MSQTGAIRTLEIPEGLDGERVDVALARALGFSRTMIATAAERGNILVNGKPVDKSARLGAGDLIEIEIVQEVDRGAKIEVVDLDELQIIYSDDDVLVIDKPLGVAAHPSVGWSGPTVVGILMARGITLSHLAPPERAGIVHRLDVGTSGLMVVAKSDRAYLSLKEQFRSRTVKKTYHAIVQGHPDPTRGTIDAPIDRHPRDEFKFAVVADGKPSITHYQTLESFAGATLVEIELETGRTHQIRVHFAALRHPLIGDLMYGADPVFAKSLGLTRQWLHAHRLTFLHPADGQERSYISAYSADLEAALASLRSQS
ncbi:MAG: RluA family pseudouridine synthase [Actinobacteria bacterium]|nr:RluA family pseudouridine synthase [Actinomycetota bacterium]